MGQDAGGIGGLLAITIISNGATRVFLPMADHNGNIRALLDAGTGRIACEYEYSPFGVLVGAFGPAAGLCNLRFQSKYYDPETELYYFGYRYYDPASAKWLSNDPKGETADEPNLTLAFGNDPVNRYDPDGREAYIVYREFADAALKKKFPKQGHVFLAFDEKGISNVGKWRDKVYKKLGPYAPAGPQSAFPIWGTKIEDAPDANMETFSFHPWEVYDEGEGHAYNVAGILLSASSYIGYGDRIDRDAFRNARDNLNLPDAPKAMVFPLHVTEQQQFDLYQKAIASRNINNLSPQSGDIGWYMVGAQNCGSWTVWLTEQVKGVKYPSDMRKYNRLPLLPRVSIGGRIVFPGASVGGIGLGGVADYTLLPQTVTILAGTGGTVYEGARFIGYGLYRGGEAIVGAGRIIVNRAEFMQPEGGFIGWRF